MTDGHGRIFSTGLPLMNSFSGHHYYINHFNQGIVFKHKNPLPEYTAGEIIHELYRIELSPRPCRENS